MQNPPPVQTEQAKSSTGLDENIAALLSYVFGWISGLIFFLIEKDSRLVRFHAMQSLLFNVLVAALIVPALRQHGFRNSGTTTLHIHAVLASPVFEAMMEV